MGRNPPVMSTQNLPATQPGTLPTHVVNTLRPQPSIFGNGYSQSWMQNKSNSLAMQSEATPRNFLQAEDSRIGMLSSDDNAKKGYRTRRSERGKLMTRR